MHAKLVTRNLNSRRTFMGLNNRYDRLARMTMTRFHLATSPGMVWVGSDWQSIDVEA